jgi:Zn-dependent protease with chaperone function
VLSLHGPDSCVGFFRVSFLGIRLMRKYQEYRDDARGMTRGLCVFLTLAVIATIVLSSFAAAAVVVGAGHAYLSATTRIVMPAEYWQHLFFRRLVDAGGLVLFAVVATAAYRIWQLTEEGGRAVAKSLGGSRVQSGGSDLDHLKLLNVVEELAIAAGMRVPALYVLEAEPGINAFAAGWNSKDAVIGVTRGAIDKLKRDQLQGVLAHEFSHIANGDMRLNIRLLGILAGIQSITLAARYLLRLAMPTSKSHAFAGGGKHPLGMALALAFGGVLWPIGQIGSFFAMLVHRAVNRQREFLADASAVQYTRDPQGLREALIVLLNDKAAGGVQGPGAQLASYMFFASDGGVWERLIGTHPPLEERIRRLDPASTLGDVPTESPPLAAKGAAVHSDRLVTTSIAGP